MTDEGQPARPPSPPTCRRCRKTDQVRIEHVIGREPDPANPRLAVMTDIEVWVCFRCNLLLSKAR